MAVVGKFRIDPITKWVGWLVSEAVVATLATITSLISHLTYLAIGFILGSPIAAI